MNKFGTRLRSLHRLSLHWRGPVVAPSLAWPLCCTGAAVAAVSLSAIHRNIFRHVLIRALHGFSYIPIEKDSVY